VSKSSSPSNPTLKPISSLNLRQRKQKQNPDASAIVMLTAYDYSTAKILDQTGEVDCILVGDSLGMVMLGYPTTTQVTMDDMLHHVKAVRRGTQRALLLADMPFGSTFCDESSALMNMTRMVQEGGADAVKIEGASALTCRIIAQATQHGIPVVGHLGFTPQSVQTLGGFHLQAKTMDAVKQLITDALALQQAGVFALVLEMIPWQVAELLTAILDIPTVGIGAGQYCDGQVLVIDDFMGKFPDLKPRFVRQYLNVATQLTDAIHTFRSDIETHQFPASAETFSFPSAALADLEALSQSYGVLLSHPNSSKPSSVSVLRDGALNA
jgi:3-methyl-2-oxobutanoate hydroxymethyltransferase